MGAFNVGLQVLNGLEQVFAQLTPQAIVAGAGFDVFAQLALGDADLWTHWAFYDVVLLFVNVQLIGGSACCCALITLTHSFLCCTTGIEVTIEFNFCVEFSLTMDTNILD